jgi:hypothetical protein
MNSEFRILVHMRNAQAIAKTQQHVTKRRGPHCGDIELATYLANVSGPVPLVLDLLITHDRFGSSPDPSLNGHLHYPNDIDKSLNEVTLTRSESMTTIITPRHRSPL